MLEDAAASVGFADGRLVPEPVGDAVVVYDFGGCTFDASVVTRTPAGFEVLAVDGSEALGGVDIDHAVANHIGRQFDGDSAWTDVMNPTVTARQRHRRAFYEDVRSAKELLSRLAQVGIPVPALEVDTHVTRAELKEITRPLLEPAVAVTRSVIREAGLPADRGAGVFLVGGASRMPLAATMLR